VSHEEARARRKEAGQWVGIAWGVAILPNALAAFGFEPDGWGWLALRIGLCVLLSVVFVVWLVLLVRERRSARAERSAPTGERQH